MPELLTERTVLTTFAALAVLGMFVLLCRARRVSTSVEDATLAALHRVTSAAPHLRDGLGQESADRTAPHLRELLSCGAVGIVDAEGQLLSWDGGANHHYEDLRGTVEQVLRTGKREYVGHSDVPCEHRSCPMRHAIVVPLDVEGETRGALVIIADGDRKRLLRASEEVAHHVATQLELAELQESRRQLAQAEVRALRAQISPHFIYNALNTISSLIRTDPDHARDLLQEFADFTRYSFRTTGLYTTLADEIRNIDRYLTLERARFGPDRLKVQLKIAPEVLPVVVPFLALQPLVENAVRHGLADKPGGGTVTLIAEDNGTEALISVDDDGVGMDPERLDAELADAHMTGAHVGLGNINNRMRATFGNDYALVVETEQGAGMKVVMRVPKFAPGVCATPGSPGEESPGEEGEQSADGSAVGRGGPAGGGAADDGAADDGVPAESDGVPGESGGVPAGGSAADGAERSAGEQADGPVGDQQTGDQQTGDQQTGDDEQQARHRSDGGRKRGARRARSARDGQESSETAASLH